MKADYSTLETSPTSEQIAETIRTLLAKTPDKSGDLLLNDEQLLTATRLRLFAEKNNFTFFGSAVRPKPYDFIIETTYAHTYSRPTILYGFIIPTDGGWLEIGQYEDKEVLPPAPDAETIITGLLNPEVDPAASPGEVYFRLYPGCALPHIEIVANEDYELLLEHHERDKHVLEGDFSSHFTVFASTLSQSEVREVLTPNVMANLIDVFAGTSMELSEKGLFAINGNFSLGNAKNIQESVEYATILTNRLLYQIIDTAKYKRPKQLPKSSERYISTVVSWGFSLWSVAKFLIALAIGAVIILLLILTDSNARQVFFH